MPVVFVVFLTLALVLGGCSSRRDGGAGRPVPSAAVTSGPPPVRDPDDVYAATRPGRLAEVARRFPARVYVPDSGSNTVDVIDARTFKRIRRFAVGRRPQHVTPSWDLRTLWVGNNRGNSLTAIDPASGRRGRTVRVDDPYNLYFTPDGRRAIVVAEALRRLDFRDPRTMRLRHGLRVPCRGVDHLDFSADGRRLLASCEFSGHLLHVDVARERVVGMLRLRPAPSHRMSSSPPTAASTTSPTWRCTASGSSTRGDPGSSGSSTPASARTRCTPAATPATCTSPTGAKGRSR
jgi:YVTN family beta-propeller protein